MSDAGDTENKGDEGEAEGVTAVSYAEADVDGDGVTDAVEVTSVTAVDVDGDGVADAVEVTTIAAVDVDGDGVPDAVVMRTATAVDVDGDGVPDVVEIVEAVGVDVDGDGVIDDDEIEITDTVIVRGTRTPTEPSGAPRAALMDWPIIAIAALGAAVLGGSVAGALLPEIHPREQRVFRAVNGLPGWLYWPLWGPMQLGNLVVGTVAGLLAALVWGDWPMAVAVVLAMVLKLGRRARPAASDGRAPQRAPATGHERAGSDPARRRRAGERAQLPVGSRDPRRRHRQRGRERHPGRVGVGSSPARGARDGRPRVRRRAQPARRDRGVGGSACWWAACSTSCCAEGRFVHSRAVRQRQRCARCLNLRRSSRPSRRGRPRRRPTSCGSRSRVVSLLAVVVIGALFDEAIVGFVADLIRGIESLPIVARHRPGPVRTGPRRWW